MTTPSNNLTVLKQLSRPTALVGKDLTVNAAGNLEIKTHSAVGNFFRDLFKGKFYKLNRIQATAEALENVITADVRARYSATGSQSDINIQIALNNVNAAMAKLKVEAQKLSSDKSSSTIRFSATGTIALNADPAVAGVLARIDQAAKTATDQIGRLNPGSLSDRTIGMFTSDPKEQQILQLRRDLAAVRWDLTIIPPTHADYELINREKVGLEYAILQLEMHIPTYAQDMKHLCEDLGNPTIGGTNLTGSAFLALPDFDPAVAPGTPYIIGTAPGGKDTAITALENHFLNNPQALAKVRYLKLIYEASLLVKAPIDFQARKATARIAAARGGIARGNLARFGVDFDRNILTNIASGLTGRGALVGLGILAYQSGFLGTIAAGILGTTAIAVESTTLGGLSTLATLGAVAAVAYPQLVAHSLVPAPVVTAIDFVANASSAVMNNGPTIATNIGTTVANAGRSVVGIGRSIIGLVWR